ncbi:MAG: sodium/proton-translocating pyrophosphatase, partial [Planctomycetota bacterium]
MKGLLKTVALGMPLWALSATAMASADGTAATEAVSSAAKFAPYLAVVCSVAALAMAIYFYKKMMSAPEGTEQMIEIATHVREGAIAYLVRQYKVVAMVFVVLLAIFAFLAYKGLQNPFVPVAFLTGG